VGPALFSVPLPFHTSATAAASGRREDGRRRSGWRPRDAGKGVARASGVAACECTEEDWRPTSSTSCPAAAQVSFPNPIPLHCLPLLSPTAARRFCLPVRSLERASQAPAPAQIELPRSPCGPAAEWLSRGASLASAALFSASAPEAVAPLWERLCPKATRGPSAL
jgi:hypothetical protein